MKNLREQILSETSVLHKVAERSGYNTVLLKGNSTREMYGDYLFYKYQIYTTLEDSLIKSKTNHVVQQFIFPELERSKIVASDLNNFLPDWKNHDSLASVQTYQHHLMQLAENDPEMLIAHAYNTYLAELSGGQIIKGVLMKQYGYKENELKTYDFQNISDINKFKEEYHAALDLYFNKDLIKDKFIQEVRLSFIFSIASLTELLY